MSAVRKPGEDPCDGVGAKGRCSLKATTMVDGKRYCKKHAAQRKSWLRKVRQKGARA